MRYKHLALVTFLLGCLITLSAFSAPRSVILVLGDSISAGHGIAQGQGWVTLMEQRLKPANEYQVVNGSISGDTSSGALSRLPQLLELHRPQLVILEIGGNDGLRGYPVSGLRDNLSHMIELSRQAGAQVLLLGMQIPPNYGPRYTEMFRQSFHLVAQQHQVPLIPFILEDIALKPELMQEDGIHPNTQAQPLIVQNVLPKVEALLN